MTSLYHCQQCGIEFPGKKNKGRKNRYCSPACYHLSKRKPIDYSTDPGGTYICSICKIEKPISMFHKRVDRPIGIASHCKECHHKYHYDLDTWRARRLHREYKTDPETYNKLFLQQEGKCAICGCVARENGRGQLALDHSHETFLVRGLLCFRCNTLIGQVEKTGLGKIIKYLEK
jgi:hypothetical protein